MRFFSFWFYPPLALVLLAWAGLGSELPVLSVLLLVLLGLLAWTLLEYLLHRFLFHPGPAVSSSALNSFRRKVHLHHHADPRNADRILIKPVYSLPISLLFGMLLLAATGDAPASSSIMAGLWVGFLYYETVHYRVHLSKRSGPLLKFQRRAHFHHHFVDETRRYGVTSPLWDLVFGTFRDESSGS